MWARKILVALLLVVRLVVDAAALTVNPTDPPYNAKCDAVVCLDCSMTSGSAVLSATTNHFSVSDVGKVIAVYGAGSLANDFRQPLSTTIVGFTDAKHVTLATPASATVTNSERVVWGTNDTVALQAAIDAVTNGGGVVQFPGGICLGVVSLPCAAIGVFPVAGGTCTKTYNDIRLAGLGKGVTTIENWDIATPSGSAVVNFGSLALDPAYEPGNAMLANLHISDLTIRQVKYPTAVAFITRNGPTIDLLFENVELIGSSYEGVAGLQYDSIRSVFRNLTMGPCGGYGPTFSGHGCLNIGGRDWIVENSTIKPTQAFVGDVAWCSEMSSYRGIWRNVRCDKSDFPANSQGIVMGSSGGGMWDTLIEDNTFLNARIEVGNGLGIAKSTTIRRNTIVNGQVALASGYDRNNVNYLEGNGLPAHGTSVVSDNHFIRSAFTSSQAIQGGVGPDGLESILATGNTMTVTSRHFYPSGASCITDADPGGPGIYGCAVTDLFYTHSVGASLWQPTTAYATGTLGPGGIGDDHVAPTISNGFQYRVTAGGTSGSTEPTWPLVIGATVVDGSVTWINDGKIDVLLANNTVRGPAGTTATTQADIKTFSPGTRATLTIINQVFDYGWTFQWESGNATVGANTSYTTPPWRGLANP